MNSKSVLKKSVVCILTVIMSLAISTAVFAADSNDNLADITNAL